MKILFYAYTPGPAGCLELISKALAAAGHIATQAPRGAPISEIHLTDARVSDAIVIGGPDSMYIESHLELAKAASRHNVPLIVIEDVPGTSMRPQFRPFAEKVVCVLIANPSMEAEVRAFGYSDVRYIGPPPHWGKTRDDIHKADKQKVRAAYRKRLANGQLYPLAEGDIVIGYSGIKQHAINRTILEGLVAAGADGSSHRFLRFRPHPAEPKDAVAIHERNKFLEVLPAIVVVEEGVKLSPAEEIVGADIPIFAVGATDSIVCSYPDVGIAAGYFYDADCTEYMIKQLGIEGGRWAPADLGGVKLINGPEEFSEALQFLLSTEGKRALRETQLKNFPAPPTWDTADFYASAVVDVVASRLGKAAE